MGQQKLYDISSWTGEKIRYLRYTESRKVVDRDYVLKVAIMDSSDFKKLQDQGPLLLLQEEGEEGEEKEPWEKENKELGEEEMDEDEDEEDDTERKSPSSSLKTNRP